MLSALFAEIDVTLVTYQSRQYVVYVNGSVPYVAMRVRTSGKSVLYILIVNLLETGCSVPVFGTE
jgi:hypothetical protein